MLDFLNSFAIDNMAFYVGDIYKQEGKLFTLEKNQLSKIQEIINAGNVELFFAPANTNQKSLSLLTKDSLTQTKFLWVDIDSPKVPLQLLLKPTYTVVSGKGFHCYWELNEPVTIEMAESINKLLAYSIPGADKGSWNFNRWLRVPESYNFKYTPAKKVVLHKHEAHKYNIEDFSIFGLASKTTHKITTGDTRGYIKGDKGSRSLSELDFKVALDLVSIGQTEEQIFHVFETQPIGKHYRETNNPNYLKTTIKNARAALEETNTEKDTYEASRHTGLFSKGLAYYYSSGNKTSKVTNFIFEVRYILQNKDGEDVLALTAHTETGEKIDVVWPRKVFNNKSTFHRYNQSVHMSVTTNDSVFERLLPYLMATTPPEKVIPATNVLGLHEKDDEYFIVGPHNVISKDKIYDRYGAPITFSFSEKTIPDVREFEKPQSKLNLEKLLRVNQKELMLILAGWYSTAILKDVMFKKGYRFPMLSVAGTHGSGKTTLIKLMSDLFGQDAITHNADTTKFVLLSLLGSTNLFPVNISEYRRDTGDHLTRFLLLSYDSGKDSRGTADQRVNEYPLIAPFTLDGEEYVQDPASRERIVVLTFPKENTRKDSEYYDNFMSFSYDKNFFTGFAQFCLSQIDTIEQRMKRIYKEFDDAFTTTIQTRMAHNHCMIHFGVELLHEYLNMNPPSLKYLEYSLKHLVNLNTGVSRLLIDRWTEDVISFMSNSNSRFEYNVDKMNGVVYISPLAAHNQWERNNSAKRQPNFSLEAVRNQLTDVPYINEVIRNKSIQFEIDLNKALEYGLQIDGTIINEFKGKL